MTEGTAAREPAPEVVAQESGHVRQVPTSELVARAVARWRRTLVDLAGPSSLTDIDLLGEASLDLAGAHPSGIAQLFAGRATRLTSLFRDSGTQRTARRRMRQITRRAHEQAERYGVAPTYLAIGVATWQEKLGAQEGGDDVAALARATGPAGAPSGEQAAGTLDGHAGPDDGISAAVPDEATEQRAIHEVHAPVVLRPLTLRVRGDNEDDYELTLEPSAEINPVVSRALRSRGALIDPAALARSTFDESGFHPGRAMDRLDALGRAVFENFALVDRSVVGTFAHPGQQLVDDLDELTGLEHHEVVASLAGSGRARELLDASLPAEELHDGEPNMERGVGDLDPSGRRVLTALATGGHLFVDAPPGADTPGVIAAAVAEAAAIGRSVLYVPGHRRASTALKSRLHDLDLDDLVLDVPATSTWRTEVSRRLLGAMTTDADPVDLRRISTVRRELLTTRETLDRTIEALHAPHPSWGVSAYQALQSLVELTSQQPGPATRVRLEPDVAQAMDSEARAVYAESLQTLAASGGLAPPVVGSPWYGARLADDVAVDQALALVEHLLDDRLVALAEDIETAGEELGGPPPGSVAAWREQLTVLARLRESLDVFQPRVFERSQDELVAATATRAWRDECGIEMTGTTRRRLVKQARDLLRPGRHVEDLHGALQTAQQRRAAWLDAFPDGGWPRLPRELARFESTLTDVLDGVHQLEEVLGDDVEHRAGLLEVPFAELTDRLAALRTDPETLRSVRRAAHGAWNLRAMGLGPLLDDLSARAVPATLVPAELELAWWSAVFDSIVAGDPHLSQIDSTWIDTLAARFRALDAEHIRLLSQPVTASAVDQIHRALTEFPTQADELFAELVDERLLSVRSTMTNYPDVVRRLRPVLVATPSLVPQLVPPHRTVDLVVIDAVQHLPVESVVSAIARGRQVMIVGDPRCASGTAVRELAAVLPQVTLAGDAGGRDPRLTQLLCEHGYAGLVRSLPRPSEESLISADFVDGTGMPSRTSGIVEATRAEVDRVVEHAVYAAVQRPEESLAIITSTPAAADLVRDGLLAQVKAHPELAEFFDPRRAEPVVVSDLVGVCGLRRDTLVYSVAFGRTPHGRVLHRFGVLGTPSGGALLLDALGVTRHRLTVVSSIQPDDLDRARLTSHGTRLLADLLELAQSTRQGERVDDAPSTGDAEAQPNRLVVDLAERLYRSGLTVETSYGSGVDEHIPLVVGHPDYPGEMFVAVLTDDDDYVREPSVRVRDRLRAVRLEKLGWAVLQVWSVSLFLDPEVQTNRIRQTVLEIAEQRRQAATGPHLTPWDAEGDAWLRQVLRTDGGRDGEAAPSNAATSAGSHDEHVAVPQESVESAQDRAARAPQTAATPAVLAPTGALPIVQPNLFELAEPGAAVPGTTDSPRGARPAVAPNLPISVYSDDELDDLVAWVASDGVERDDDTLAAALRAELGIVRRNHRVDTAVAQAVARLRG